MQQTAELRFSKIVVFLRITQPDNVLQLLDIQSTVIQIPFAAGQLNQAWPFVRQFRCKLLVSGDIILDIELRIRPITL